MHRNRDALIKRLIGQKRSISRRSRRFDLNEEEVDDFEAPAADLGGADDDDDYADAESCRTTRSTSSVSSRGGRGGGSKNSRSHVYL